MKDKCTGISRICSFSDLHATITLTHLFTLTRHSTNAKKKDGRLFSHIHTCIADSFLPCNHTDIYSQNLK